MRVRKIWLALSIWTSVLASLSPSAAIVGASGDPAPFAERLVMVLTRGAEGSGLCTGVVLSPRILLTAAHCLRAPSEMRVFFRGASDEPVVFEVAATLAHPDYHADAAATRTRSLDIGLIALKTALPAVFRAATLAAGDPPPPGAPVAVAGFGVSREGEWKSGGRLAAAQLRVRAPRSRVLLWAAPTAAESGACAGDSGGPMFTPGESIVVAIVAWTEGAGKAKCGRLTQGVLVAPLAGWLAANVRRLGGENGAAGDP